MPDFCKTEREGHLLIVTLDRPDVLNALHPPANRELAKAFDDFAADPELWVAILTGAGRGFCAGNDLKHQASGGDMSGQPATGFAGLTGRTDLPKPVIAAVNGVAMGGGFEIALACDLIIASEDATFALPEPRVGLAALAGGIHRLPRQIGLKNAMGMLLTGRRVSAEEGQRLGFVNEVVPKGEAARRREALGRADPRVRAALGAREQAGRLPGPRGRPGRGDGQPLRRAAAHAQERGLRRGTEGLRRETPAALEGALSRRGGPQGGPPAGVIAPPVRGRSAGHETGILRKRRSASANAGRRTGVLIGALAALATACTAPKPSVADRRARHLPRRPARGLRRKARPHSVPRRAGDARRGLRACLRRQLLDLPFRRLAADFTPTAPARRPRLRLRARRRRGDARRDAASARLRHGRLLREPSPRHGARLRAGLRHLAHVSGREEGPGEGAWPTRAA